MNPELRIKIRQIYFKILDATSDSGKYNLAKKNNDTTDNSRYAKPSNLSATASKKSRF